MDLSPLEEVEQKRILRTGPWCWPAEGTPEFEASLLLIPSGPAELPPGQVPLLTADAEEGAGSLWSLCYGELPATPTPNILPFEGSAERAWQTAALAVPRSLPFLWSDVRAVTDRSRFAAFLGQSLLRDCVSPKPKQLTGESFGLSFVLAIVSMVLEKPISLDFAASAAVSADGAVRPVSGLRAKCAVLKQCAPRVTKLLVAAEQEELVREFASGLEIVPIKSAAQAITRVFGKEAFSARLREYQADPSKRQQIVDFFFRLAMVAQRKVFVDWEPIAQAASVVWREWQELDEQERWKVEVARGVASRHSGGRELISLPRPGQLERFPQSLEIGLVAQLVQHCHDVGQPTRKEIWSLLDNPRYFVELDQGFNQHLATHGARARLLAVTGHPTEALELDERLARAWADRLEYDHISFPLSEWYRLSGALSVIEVTDDDKDRVAAYNRAEQMREWLSTRVGFEAQSAAYVHLARARAQVEMSGVRVGLTKANLDLQSLLEELSQLTRDTAFVPFHVRHSALRFKVSLLEKLGEHDEVESILAQLRGADSGDASERSVTARRALILIRLDRALRDRSEEAAAAALAELTKSDPGPLSHLTSVPNPPCGQAAYVACFYPY